MSCGPRAHRHYSYISDLMYRLPADYLLVMDPMPGGAGSLMLERSQPRSHEQILEPPRRLRSGEVLAQEMLMLERLERALHRGARKSVPQRRRRKLELDRLLAHDAQRLLLGMQVQQPALKASSAATRLMTQLCVPH